MPVKIKLGLSLLVVMWRHLLFYSFQRMLGHDRIPVRRLLSSVVHDFRDVAVSRVKRDESAGGFSTRPPCRDKSTRSKAGRFLRERRCHSVSG